MQIDVAPVPDAVANALRIENAVPAPRMRRVRRIGAQPVWYTTAYFPTWLALRVRGGTGEPPNLLDLLEASGGKVAEVDETIGAVLADPEAAEQLNAVIGAPLLESITQVFDEAGDPVSFHMTLGPPERCRIRVARPPISAVTPPNLAREAPATVRQRHLYALGSTQLYAGPSAAASAGD